MLETSYGIRSGAASRKPSIFERTHRPGSPRSESSATTAEESITRLRDSCTLIGGQRRAPTKCRLTAITQAVERAEQLDGRGLAGWSRAGWVTPWAEVASEWGALGWAKAKQEAASESGWELVWGPAAWLAAEAVWSAQA